MANDDPFNVNPNDSHDEEESPAPAPAPERTMSRAAAFVAMGIVALAIVLLLMLRPGSGVQPDAPPPGAQVQAVTPPVAEGADPNDAQATGKDAPLHFTLKDMNGVD